VRKGDLTLKVIDTPLLDDRCRLFAVGYLWEDMLNYIIPYRERHPFGARPVEASLKELRRLAVALNEEAVEPSAGMDETMEDAWSFFCCLTTLFIKHGAYGLEDDDVEHVANVLKSILLDEKVG